MADPIYIHSTMCAWGWGRTNWNEWIYGVHFSIYTTNNCSIKLNVCIFIIVNYRNSPNSWRERENGVLIAMGKDFIYNLIQIRLMLNNFILEPPKPKTRKFSRKLIFYALISPHSVSQSLSFAFLRPQSKICFRNRYSCAMEYCCDDQNTKLNWNILRHSHLHKSSLFFSSCPPLTSLV